MKQFFLFIGILFTLNSTAQTGAQSIVGKWMKIPKEDLVIEVYQTAKGFNGKISWVKPTDTLKQVGFLILEDLAFNAQKKFWENGKIYSPGSGNVYSADATIKPDGTLEVLGYKGMKFIGKKKYFRRVK